MVVFSKAWFEKHQRPLLWFVNTWIGKRFFRISRDVPKGKRIVKILPNCFTWEEGKKEDGRTVYAADFRTHDKFAKRLYYSLKPVWYLLHFIDWLFSFSPVPQLRLNFGFDTLTVYPDPGISGTTVDGFAMRIIGSGETWATMRGGAGNLSAPSASSDYLGGIDYNSTGTGWRAFFRYIATFDTASLEEDDLIVDATLSFYGNYKVNSLGLSDADASIVLVGSSPVVDNNVYPADYGNLGAVRYCDTDLAYSTFSITSYNDSLLNNTGKAAIDANGITKIGALLAADFLDNEPSSPSANQATNIFNESADTAGTSKDPKLVITYTLFTPDHDVTLSETLTLSDEVETVKHEVTLSETLTLSDGVTIERGYEVTLSETLTLSDEVETVKHEVTLSETLTLSDGVETYLPGHEYDFSKDKKTGSAPVWVMKIEFATGTVYLSDHVFTITDWTAEGGSKTTKKWVNDWQQIDGDIAGGLNDNLVSDMTLDILVDPVDSPNNWHNLIWDPSNLPETTKCTLFLWLKGLDASTDPPRAKWVGNIKDPKKLDELHYSVNFIDESLQFNSPLGTLLDPADFPGADPDDIGKMIPIGYGSLKNVPGLATNAGVTDLLAEDLSAAAATVKLSNTDKVAALPTSGTGQLENEQFTWAGKSGTNLTGCVRGTGGTTATTHDSGMQFWEIKSEYWWTFLARPSKSIPAIRVDGVLQTGGDFTTYTDHNGMTKVKFDARPVFQKSADVEVDDNVDVTDYAVSHNDGISHNASAIENQVAAQLYDYGSPQNWAEGSGNYKQVARFTHPSFSYGEIQVVIQNTAVIENGFNDKTFYCRLRQGGNTSSWQAFGFRPGSSSEGWTWHSPTLLEFTTISSGDTYIDVYHTGSDEIDNWNTLVCTRTAKANADVTGTGTSSKSPAIKDKIDGGKGYHIALTGNSTADVVIGKVVTADIEAEGDDGSGTYTGTPNALIERPDHVFKHFLAIHCNYTAFVTDAAANFAANNYKFAGIMNVKNKTTTRRWWLNRLAWQCRSWFRFHAGEAKLTWRADTITSTKTIPSGLIRMKEGGLTSMQGPSLSPLHEVINKFDIKYNRDWTKSGDGAYKGLKPWDDATSIDRYGEKDGKADFNFDFVTSTAMVIHVGDFYLAKLKDRKRMFTFDTWLMNEELEFGAGVTLAPPGDILCEVKKPDIHPGSGKKDRIDRMTIEVRED